jgi:hypothetical protein
MDVVAAEVWVVALHCYGDSNDGDNNDVGDDNNGGDRDGDNTHSYDRGNRDVEALVGEVAGRMDVAAMEDAAVAAQTL